MYSGFNAMIFFCIQYWIGLSVVMQSIAAPSLSFQPICLKASPV